MTEAPNTGVPTEAELIARSDAPRVTAEALKENIKQVDYYVHPGSQLTICIITLQNGYTVNGESACADPANFKKDVGERFAYASAEKKIWPLMGYKLKQELFEASIKGEGSTFLDRVKAELFDLNEKLQKLNTFIEGNEHFKALDSMDRELLVHQRSKMRDYASILEERIQRSEAVKN